MKKILLGLLLLLFPTFVHAYGEVGNSKPVTVSSQAGSSWAGSKANDGNQGSYWEGGNWQFPATISIDLQDQYTVDKLTLKLPSGWGPRNETITVSSSTDGTNFTQLVSSAVYSLGTQDITFTATQMKAVKLSISANSAANAGQLSEFEVYGDLVTPTPTPTATPTPTNTLTPTPTSTPTPTPTPTPNPWTVQSVDVMKYTKDVVCNPPSQTTIDTMVQKAVDLGVDYVAISTPYENPGCGSSLTLTTAWVNSIRSHGLKVWHRHTSLAFEGLYGVAKKYNGDHLQTMSNYIINNPTLFQSGDIFTPYPEPEVAGINGVTWCGGTCQFSSASDFNQWLRNAQTVAKLSFQVIGVSNVKVGYYGTNGFIVFGENNPDWYGHSFLEASTVTAMDNVISMDSYPETYSGGSMAAALDAAHSVWPSAQFVIGEWGTITATNSAQATSQINSAMGAASSRSWVKGFNYWNLGPSGNEGLLNNDLTNKSQFDSVKFFFQ